MALRTPPAWLQAGSYTAENDRLTAQASYTTTGTVGLTSMAVTAQSSPNMTVNVATGWASIVGNFTTNMGAYLAYNDAVQVLNISTADPTNPRIDLIVATVSDAAYTGSSNQVVFQVLTGTPAGSPAAPALPTNSVSLATVAVAANATTVSQANITDTRVPAESNLVYAKPSQNVLINGGFDVWQRGTSGFTTGASYTADRWRLDTVSNTTIAQATLAAGLGSTYGLSITTSNATNSCSISQPIESVNIAPLRGQFVTFSFYASATVATTLSYAVQGSTTADNAAATFTTLTGGSGSVSLAANVPQRVTVTVQVPTTTASNGLRVRFTTSNNANGSTITVYNTQLELGQVASVFRRQQNTYAAELLACQRYYVQWPTIVGSVLGAGYAVGATAVRLIMTTPAPMRVLPTSISQSNLQVFSFSGGSLSSLSAPLIDNGSGNIVDTSFTCSGLTGGNTYLIRNAASGNGFLELVAEL